MGQPGSRKRDDEHMEPQQDHGPQWLACCKERDEEAHKLDKMRHDLWNRLVKFGSLMEMQRITDTPHAVGLLRLYNDAYNILKSLAEQVRA